MTSAARQPGGSASYRVSHRTTYEYRVPMADGYTVAYLLPRPTAYQTVESAAVLVTPQPDERAERIDVFGNRVLQIGVHHAHDTLTLDARSEVVVSPAEITARGEPWEIAAQRIAALRGGDAIAVRPFIASSTYVSLAEHGPALRAIAEQGFSPHQPIVEGVRQLCHHIHTTFDYDPAFTDVSTPLSAVLEGRRGVCQDFAHLAAGCLRSLGLAARYVSGYIETSPRRGEGPLTGADASHAWCAVWVPQQGWIDFDPTNDQFPVHRHVTVAWGRDYGDVAPVRGVVIGPVVDQALTVEVRVERRPDP